MAKRGRPATFSDNENIVAQLRKKLALSQQALSGVLGITGVRICLLETGKAQPSKTLKILCKILLEHPDVLKDS